MKRYTVERQYSVAGIWQGLWNVLDTETGKTVETHTKEIEAHFGAWELNGSPPNATR
jgi:hypothetical protein